MTESKKTEMKKPEKVDQFFVAEGVEVTTKRGQLKPGKQVKQKDFPRGQKTIDELVKSGALVKK